MGAPCQFWLKAPGFSFSDRESPCARSWTMSLFGAWDQLGAFRDVDDLLHHFAVGTDVWTAFEAQIGNPGADIRLLSALPRTALVAGCNVALRADGSGLTAIQATQVGLVWRMARRITAYHAGTLETDYVDVDPWEEKPESYGDKAARGSPTLGGGSGVKERVLKMASLIDQTDESELLPPAAADVDKWYQNYVVIMGALPDESEEPTASQLAALAKRTLHNDQAPYTDFAVWTPYERKMSKVQKCRTYTPLGDGSFLQRDLPGPGSLQAWKASWAVFKTASMMLNIVGLAALDSYQRHIERLAIQWPSCWGLIYAADDLARAEKLERVRRTITAEAARGRQVPVDWNPSSPWTCVFQVIIKDTEFWADKVHHPAAAWTASGGRGAPVVATEAAVLNVIPGGNETNNLDMDERTQKKRQSNRDKKLAKKQRKANEKEDLHGKSAFQTSEKPKGKGKGKSKDQAGNAICFSWASGQGACASVPPGGECAGTVKRVHKCRICLSPSHRDGDCSRK